MQGNTHAGPRGPLMIDLRGTELAADERAWLQAPAVGGVILFSRNFRDLRQLGRLVAAIHALRSPPLLVAVDHEGGRVQRFRDPFTELPPMRALGRLFDRDRERALATARACGWLAAAELRALGIDLNFAPVVDLDLGLAEVIGDRALHADVAAVSALGAAFAAGARAAGMAATAKHFPTHGGARADSHAALAQDPRELVEMNDDLEPYRRLIGAGIEGVMVGHVVFPAVDRMPASLSPLWMREQLRERLGFDGAVLSDDMSMAGAEVGGDCRQRLLRSLEAGCDMALLCNSPGDIPGCIEALAGYRNPASGERLGRLAGGARIPWETLRESAEWRTARDLVDALGAQAGSPSASAAEPAPPSAQTAAGGLPSSLAASGGLPSARTAADRAAASRAVAEALRIRASARRLFSPAQVGAALDRMAAAAAQVLARQNPLVLAVMNGGAFTAVELCRRWDFPYELDFVHATRYDEDLVGGALRWRTWPDRDLAGRTVFVVDDILDQGDTLAAVRERLLRGGAGQVHLAVLAVKRLEQPRDRVEVGFAGLEVEDAYVFGCGMDYKGYWRGLTGIHAVDPQAS